MNYKSILGFVLATVIMVTSLTFSPQPAIASESDSAASEATNTTRPSDPEPEEQLEELTLTANSSDNTYGYNLANQLVAAQLAANPPPENTVETGIATDLTYSYDGNGLLSGKTKANGSTGSSDSYVWNTNTSIAQLIEDGKYNYIYGLGSTPLAQVDKTTSNVEYLHGDSIGSVSLVTDSVGLEVAQYTYDDYGVQTAGELGHATTRFGYAGQYLDEDTGYYYMRARWYDPVTAQFITVDPALATTNLPYGYTVGNPLSYIDPLGLSSETLAFLNGAAGFINGMSGGLYEAYLGAVAPGVIDICSNVYQVGNVAGSVAGLAVPGAAGVKIAGLIVKAGAGLFKTVKVAGTFVKTSPRFQSLVSQLKSSNEIGGVGKAVRRGVQEGDIGAYGALSDAGLVGDKLTAHHMPSRKALEKFLGYTSAESRRGGSIVMTEADHTLTRTFGGRNNILLKSEINDDINDIFKKDLDDYVAITGNINGAEALKKWHKINSSWYEG